MLDNVKQNGAVKASYTWAADGVKISAVSGNDGFEYLGSMVFSKTYSGLEPESVAFSEGRFLPTFAISSGGKFAPVFHHRNHLGSVCAESVIGHEMPLKTANDYMPYGTRFSADGYGEISQYTFSGKERQTVGSLGLLDFGARMYDPTTCRWLTNDPLAERYYNVSPYVYAGANPIRYIDPDGRKLVDTKGNLMWNNGNWTKYATQDVQRLGNQMMQTQTGREQFAYMVNHEANVTVKVDKTTKPGDYGKNDVSYIEDKNTGKVKLESAEITIYEQLAQRNARQSGPGITPDQAMAATFGHEIEHMKPENLVLTAQQKIAEGNHNKSEEEKFRKLGEVEPNKIKAKMVSEFNAEAARKAMQAAMEKARQKLMDALLKIK